LIVVVVAWRLLSGPPEPAQALREPPVPPPAVSGPRAGEETSEGSTATPVPPGAAAETAGPRLTVQVASFHTLRRAEETLALASERTGLPGLVVASRVDGEIWQRILLGAFVSEEEAKAAIRPLLEDGFITELIVRPIQDPWLPSLSGQDEETGDR